MHNVCVWQVNEGTKLNGEKKLIKIQVRKNIVQMMNDIKKSRVISKSVCDQECANIIWWSIW